MTKCNNLLLFCVITMRFTLFRVNIMWLSFILWGDFGLLGGGYIVGWQKVVQAAGEQWLRPLTGHFLRHIGTFLLDIFSVTLGILLLLKWAFLPSLISGHTNQKLDKPSHSLEWQSVSKHLTGIVCKIPKYIHYFLSK